MSRFKRTLSYLKGLPDQTKYLLDLVEAAAGVEQRKRVEYAVRGEEQEFTPKTLEVNGDTFIYPHISGEQELNKQLKQAAHKESYSSYAKNAHEAVTHLIAPNILGMESIKQAAALQLFAKERMHLLLLGDPGTGKTDILRSVEELDEKSVMGLGSGTTGAGLSVAYAKGELQKGLLAQADGGICCIDELNLMKKDDRAALYNAMEKGFVTYDKAGKHEKFSADVRVLATANPKGDRFEGEDVEQLRKQLPFDPALLSRFHLIFLIRKPDEREFARISEKIVKQEKARKPDTSYAKNYISHAQSIDVSFPTTLEKNVTKAAQKIKEHEEDLLIEVSPRIVKGIIGFAKASARSELRDTASRHDVRRVLDVLAESLGLDL